MAFLYGFAAALAFAGSALFGASYAGLVHDAPQSYKRACYALAAVGAGFVAACVAA